MSHFLHLLKRCSAKGGGGVATPSWSTKRVHKIFLLVLSQLVKGQDGRLKGPFRNKDHWTALFCFVF